MTATTWTINSNQSDVLIKAKHSIIAYLASAINKFKGSIAVKNDELEDASVEFLIDINSKNGKLEQFDTNLKLNDFLDTNQHPTIQFKSTSFQKVNSNINFLKGNLTINNITKVVELDAILTDLETNSGKSKALFEVVGKINRKDFGLSTTAFNEVGGIAIGQEINLIANLEFSTYSN
ncbi:YceI family protein [Flavobacterium sp. SUN052]|uniref:YceI family protein n=1 Tax=Flavobacterium sp. SUN052 TaxID=3002441 RepID=UPI00237E4E8A|nr:YceI family protein [Flavobacterium sp. SUN052]MEC4004109.1 YceI family protein [Flavobacterium sp. SUN052]